VEECAGILGPVWFRPVLSDITGNS